MTQAAEIQALLAARERGEKRDEPTSRRPGSRGLTVSNQYTDHMTIKLTATETKARILSLLDQVATGEVVEITKHGRTVARLIAAHGPRSLEGALAGVAMSAASDQDLFATGAAWNIR